MKLYQFYNLSIEGAPFFLTYANSILEADKNFKEVFGVDPTKLSHIVERAYVPGYVPGFKRNYIVQAPKTFFYKNLLTQ